MCDIFSAKANASLDVHWHQDFLLARDSQIRHLSITICGCEVKASASIVTSASIVRF